MPSNKRIVYTAGTFDVLHDGHLNFFNMCRKIAGHDGTVCVGVNSDDFIMQYRGQPSLMDQHVRASLVASLRVVDRVVINGYPQIDVMHRVFDRADVAAAERFLVIGSDWATRDYYKQIDVTRDELYRMNVLLCYVPYTEGVSSTDLKRRMSER